MNALSRLFLLLLLSTSARADPALLKLMDMSEQLDKAESAELSDLLSRSGACTAKRDFACAQKAIDASLKLAKSSTDKRQIEQARQRMVDEKQLMDKQEEERQYQLAQARQREMEESRQAEKAANIAQITAAIRMAGEQITQARIAERNTNRAMTYPQNPQTATAGAYSRNSQNPATSLSTASQMPANSNPPAASRPAQYMCTREEPVIGGPGECDKVSQSAQSRIMDEYMPIDGRVEKRNGRGVRSVSSCITKKSVNAASNRVEMDHVLVIITYEYPSTTPCEMTGRTSAR